MAGLRNETCDWIRVYTVYIWKRKEGDQETDICICLYGWCSKYGFRITSQSIPSALTACSSPAFFFFFYVPLILSQMHTNTHCCYLFYFSLSPLSLSISTHFFSLPLPSLLLPFFSRGGFLWDKCHVMVLWLHNVWFVWLCVRAWEPGCLRTAVTSQITGLTLTSPPQMPRGSAVTPFQHKTAETSHSSA